LPSGSATRAEPVAWVRLRTGLRARRGTIGVHHATAVERGSQSMLVDQPLLAYFGPEVQLPLTSLIGAISGVMLIVGGAPIRWLRRRVATLARLKGSLER
jgi:hypothetical protein